MRDFTLYFFTDEDNDVTFHYSSLADAVESGQAFCDSRFLDNADSLDDMMNWEISLYKCEFLCDKDIEGLVCGLLNGDDELDDFFGKKELVKDFVPSNKAIEELKQSL